MSKVQLTVGSDPEYMFRDRENGRIVSATDFLGNTKYNPLVIGQYGVYHDNVNVEATIPPAFSSDEFRGHFNGLFKALNTINPQYEPIIMASHTFDNDQLTHPDAREFGCSPEMCAFYQMVCPPPSSAANFRSAGGHIHIGRNDFKTAPHNAALIDIESKLNAILLCDVMLGLPLTVVDIDPTGPARKELYGDPSRFRITQYGVEYRTPSNFWTCKPYLIDFVWNQCQAIFDMLNDNPNVLIERGFDIPSIRDAIKTGDKDAAMAFIKQYGLECPETPKDYVIDL